ncbi:hypothetical protein BCM0074_p271 (plasmid) [Bacillus cereus]|nr:hypothetical protein BCM0074_p271 [Bacillus cereus]
MGSSVVKIIIVVAKVTIIIRIKGKFTNIIEVTIIGVITITMIIPFKRKEGECYGFRKEYGYERGFMGIYSS